MAAVRICSERSCTGAGCRRPRAEGTDPGTAVCTGAGIHAERTGVGTVGTRCTGAAGTEGTAAGSALELELALPGLVLVAGRLGGRRLPRIC